MCAARDKYTVGVQPCSNFMPRQDMYRDNIYECFGPYDNKPSNVQNPCRQTVSFCENCYSDHHVNGWETCGTILFCSEGMDIECLRDSDCETCKAAMEAKL